MEWGMARGHQPQSTRTLIITIINGKLFVLILIEGFHLFLVSSYMVSMLWHAHTNHLNYFKSCILIYQHKLWYSYGLLVLIFRTRSIRLDLGRCMKLQTIIKIKITMVFNFQLLLPSSDVSANIIWAPSILI